MSVTVCPSVATVITDESTTHDRVPGLLGGRPARRAAPGMFLPVASDQDRPQDARRQEARRRGSRRCGWAESSELMRRYHDTEWGVPSRDDRHLFEMLILEGAQAGLSWATILNKRARYREVFDGFDPERVAALRRGRARRPPLRPRHRAQPAEGPLRGGQRPVVPCRPGGVRHVRRVPLGVGRRPAHHQPATHHERLPARSELSDRLSADLKRRGFTFVGSTIVYSFLQSVGVVDDHIVSCPQKQRPGNRSARARR